MATTLRPKGTFVLTLFEVGSPLSLSVLYLLFVHFDKVSLLKPFSGPFLGSHIVVVCEEFHEKKPKAFIDIMRKAYHDMAAASAAAAAAASSPPPKGRYRWLTWLVPPSAVFSNRDLISLVRSWHKLSAKHALYVHACVARPLQLRQHQQRQEQRQRQRSDAPNKRRRLAPSSSSSSSSAATGAVDAYGDADDADDAVYTPDASDALELFPQQPPDQFSVFSSSVETWRLAESRVLGPNGTKLLASHFK